MKLNMLASRIKNLLFRARYVILIHNIFGTEGKKMSEQKDFATIGDIRIADDVIAAIAAIAISEIDGVADVDDSHKTALRNITITADDGGFP